MVRGFSALPGDCYFCGQTCCSGTNRLLLVAEATPQTATARWQACIMACIPAYTAVLRGLQPKDHGDNSDSDEDDDPVVQLSEDQLDRMLFRDKHFTLPSAAKAQRWQATCSAALTTLGYSEKLVELTIQALMEQGTIHQVGARVLLLEQQFIRDRLVRLRQTFQLEEAILLEECC
ncbi:hypothetical protein QJQ45_029666, partial [Haematococcus lacustris]